MGGGLVGGKEAEQVSEGGGAEGAGGVDGG